MNETRRAVLGITGGWSLIAVFRLLGVLQVKPGAVVVMAILDSAILATFFVALLWPLFVKRKDPTDE